ncbi:MAG: GIY-YIG nuclease family protein [Chitinophagaceae bacterium]
MKKEGYIYKIISPSGKIYIGQTINLKVRIRKYKSLHCKTQSKLYNSLKKYSFDKHKFEIIAIFSEELLNEKERYYQEFYDCIEKGLNCQYVDSNKKRRQFSKETRDKMSLAKKGKKLTKEHKEKISKGNLGKKVSKESRIKMSIAKLKMTNKTKKIISEKKSKKIIDTSTNIIYNSCLEVAKIFNIKRTTLNAKLIGQNKNNTTFKYF